MATPAELLDLSALGFHSLSSGWGCSSGVWNAYQVCEDVSKPEEPWHLNTFSLFFKEETGLVSPAAGFLLNTGPELGRGRGQWSPELGKV